MDVETKTAASSNADLESSLSSGAFSPGQFECDLVWQREFPIHPRLLQAVTSGGKAGTTSLALSTFKMTLESVLDWNVSNRENLYVYRDDKTGHIFYIKVVEFLNRRSGQEQQSSVPGAVAAAVVRSGHKLNLSCCNFAKQTLIDLGGQINAPSSGKI